MTSERGRDPFAMIGLTALDAAVAIGPTAVAVLMALARHSNADRASWPSVALLARESGCSPRTVRRMLRALEASGVVVTRRRFRPQGERVQVEGDDATGRGQQRTSVYVIRDAGDGRTDPPPPTCPPRPACPPPPGTGAGVSDRAGGSSASALGGSSVSAELQPRQQEPRNHTQGSAASAAGNVPTDARRSRRRDGADPVPERIATYAGAAGHDPAAYAAGQLRDDARRAFRSLPPGAATADVGGCARWLLSGWHGGPRTG